MTVEEQNLGPATTLCGSPTTAVHPILFSNGNGATSHRVITHRTALYIDFDNFFGQLMKVDPDVALQIATDPAQWLEYLQDPTLGGQPHRWLSLRCYMNSTGSLPDPDHPDRRIYFSNYRPFFVRAGFKVIDCAQLTHFGKNAADIQIVVDIMQALQRESNMSTMGYAPPIDEFLIASSDSDFTPLLHVLREADKCTTVISVGNISKAYESLADNVIDSEDVQYMMSGHVQRSTSLRLEQYNDLFEKFKTFIAAAYQHAPKPLNMAQLASQAIQEFGDDLSDSDWFGTGKFQAAVKKVQLPHIEFSKLYLWDTTRHSDPPDIDQKLPSFPPDIDLFYKVTNIPRISHEDWIRAYGYVADCLKERAKNGLPFNMTEITRAARDLSKNSANEKEETPLSRQVFNHIVSACYHTHLDLSRLPVPSIKEISQAVEDNFISRISNNPDIDPYAVRAWLHNDTEAA